MIPTLFFISLSLYVIAFILAIVNMVLMTRNVDNIEKGFVKHIIFGGIAGLFGMISLVTGIIWIVQVFAH